MPTAEDLLCVEPVDFSKIDYPGFIEEHLITDDDELFDYYKRFKYTRYTYTDDFIRLLVAHRMNRLRDEQRRQQIRKQLERKRLKRLRKQLELTRVYNSD